MDCTQAQDRILDELDGLREAPGRQELQQHLAECEPCRSFAALQRGLDAELRASIPVPGPDAGFRRALYERLATRQPWPEWLPGLAYLVGAAAATIASVAVLPFPVSSTWWIGGALAGLGLLAHSIAASVLSELDATGS
jgi:predicted anti-sigma-YlaC factor YlaD